MSIRSRRDATLLVAVLVFSQLAFLFLTWLARHLCVSQDELPGSPFSKDEDGEFFRPRRFREKTILISRLNFSCKCCRSSLPHVSMADKREFKNAKELVTRVFPLIVQKMMPYVSFRSL